jgi:uncharacterized delta-60 repeat protein
VTIFGINFLGGGSVTLGGTAATIVSVTDTGITLTSPAHAAGEGNSLLFPTRPHKVMTSLRRLFTFAAVLVAGLLPHFSPSAQAAEIQVLSNNLEVVDGDSTPRVEDRTFFGVQTVGAGNLAQTFTIKNLSTTAGDNLNLTGTPRVVIGGANPGDFVVTTQPAASVAPGASTTFVITWTPTFGGIHNATLSIANNDSNENPYDFAIQTTAMLKLTYTAGANGSIAGTTPQVVFSTATGSAVTAVPATGYHFVNWSDFSSVNPRTDTPVTANVNVTANFATGGYKLTYFAGANGSIAGTTPQTVVHAASGSAVTAVPATGYRFVNWSDGSTANPRTDTNVTANKSVTANFTAGYTFTAAAGASNPAPVDTTSPSLVLNWMICISGVYPARDGGGAVSSADGPYLGEIRCVTFDSLADFLPCDGRLLPLSQNTALFSLFGTTYGGDGHTTFALPDLRGRVPVGVSPGNSPYELGVAGGQESVTLNSSQLPSHSHGITVAPNSTGATGANQALSNQQPYLALNIGIQGGGAFSSTGWIRVFPYYFTPAGFYPCTGGMEQISSNETLFQQIGTTFGGNGLDTFGLPDLRGRSPLGIGAGAGLTSRQIGEKSGSSSLTLTTSQLPLHSHALAVGTTGITGSATALNKTQPSLALKAMIATQGAYGYISDFAPALGEVRFFAQTSTTTGFVNCDGALKSIGQYTALFAQLGTAFGGNGTQNFALPDLQGRSPVSTGQGLGLTNRLIGQKWGTETITLTTAEMPAHTHAAPAPNAPTNVVATAGNGQASLTFTTPSNNGGSAITSYTATSNPGGITGTSVGAATAITVTGLENGTVYTFAVAASNATGTSLTTGTSNSVSIPYTLSYTAGTNGTLSGNTTQLVSSFGSGTAVTAVPAIGYRFVNWSDSSTANPRIDANVTANRSVTANFAINTFTLIYAAGANGSLTGTTPQTVNYNAGGSAVTAVPATGYHFVNWGDGSIDNPRTDTNVTANVDVTANFAINTYTLTYASGANGSLTGTTPQTVNYGSSVTAVTASPATGYSFVNWSDGSTANPRTDTDVTADLSVTANFAINTHTLTYISGPFGVIAGTTPQTVTHGSSGTTVTAVPATGYHFVNWSDGSTTNPRTDTSVILNVSVTANFLLNAPTPPVPTVTLNGPATVTLQLNAAYTELGAFSGPSALAAGWRHSLALRSDGTVVAWGDAPAIPDGLSHVVAIASEGGHNLALRSDGTVVAWGYNSYGQTTVPDGLSNVVAIAGGGEHSLALRSDGTVAAWGYNSYGQTRIPAGLSNVVAISAGETQSESTALRSDGTVVAWGSNFYGPTVIPAELSNVVAISGNGYGNLALRSDGTVAGWGINTHGGLNIPDGLSNVVAISGGRYHSLALRRDGTVAAWGGNYNGQTTIPPGLSNVVAIAGGASHSLALRGDGKVFAWGYNSSGQTTVPESVYLAATVSGSVDTGTPGSYVLTYSATNLIGGSSTTTRTVVVLAPLNLTYTAGANGSITGTPSQTISNSTTASGTAVTAVPDPGYHFVSWSDGSTANPRTDTGLVADVTVTANFALGGYTLTYTAGANGSLTGATPQTVNHGSAGTTVTAVPATGYSFVNWSDGSPINPRTDTNVMMNVNVTANFRLDIPAYPDPLDVGAVFGVSPSGILAATVVQPDGKIIIAGTFTSVLGVARNRIARLNADGTIDPGFNPNANNHVYSVVVQADGKVLIGGLFTTLQPSGAATATPRNRIARLHADGSLDTDFNPNANGRVNSVVVQAGGKVLLGGEFSTLQPNGADTATTRNRIARLHADGSLDTGFDPNASSSVFSVVEQADGKVLIGGLFSTLQPNGAATATPRNYIARLNADGSLDPDFDPNPSAQIYSVVVQADGKVLIGGLFTTLQPNGAATATTRNRIARLHADGSLDPDFDPNSSAPVLSVVVQADGKVLIGGLFTTLQPNGAATATQRNRIARLHADGTLDDSFDPNANNIVQSVALQADGKVLLGGRFSTLQPNGAATSTTRNRIARLDNEAATQTLSIPDGTQALWSRGGSAPELTLVTFEVSTDGGATWGTPIAGTRLGITANWQATGLSLPAGSLLRGRGVTYGGYYNGSSGLIEQVTSFSTLTYTAGANGTLTGTTPQFVVPGANGTAVTAVPATDYSFVNWSDGSTANPRTDTNVTADLSVTANFAINTYTLTYTAGAGGSLTGTTPQTVDYGASGTAVTAVAALGYHFVDWSDGSTSNPRTDTNVTANKSVNANFALNAVNTFTYVTGAEVPLTAAGLNVSGRTVNFVLNYAPYSGTRLMVVNNTSPGFIQGTFDNLANGAPVNLTYGGRTYHYVAWYYGGDGNDLVLIARDTILISLGQDLVGSSTSTPGPAEVDQSGVLAGKTIVSLATGASHNVVLCSDGTLAAWGSNEFGQLGDGSITDSAVITDKAVPMLVDRSGVLAGKTIVSLTAGLFHNVVLCSDGTVATWGLNDYGFALDGDSTSNPTYDTAPVLLLDQSGVLAGKTVVSVSTGFLSEYAFNLVLCSDGTVALWPVGSDPFLLDQRGVLAGKTVVSLAAGFQHFVMLCSDGTVAAFGDNTSGQLGDGSTTNNNSPIPVLVDQSGLLAGKTVVSIAAGGFHTLALCSDGTVAAWGANDVGQLGDGSITDSPFPVLVDQSGELAGKTVVSLDAGFTSSVALYSGGNVSFLAFWGELSPGDQSNVPVPIVPNVAFVEAAYGNLLLAVADIPRIVTYTAGSNGTLTGTTSQTIRFFDPGTEVIAVADAGYRFVDWSDGSLDNPRIDSWEPVDLSVTANFLPNPAPVVDVLLPNTSLTTGGTSVTLSGINFLGTSSVTFGGTEATIVSVTDTGITVISPARAAGAVNVVVTTPGGSSTDVATFTYEAPANILESWRSAWYGPGATNTGNAADNADPYHTGIPNIFVFAFLGPNQSPATSQISQLPQVTRAGGFLIYQFTEPSGVSGLSYGAEWSATLGNTANWQPVTDISTVPGEHLFRVPMDSAGKFLRLSVTPSP